MNRAINCVKIAVAASLVWALAAVQSAPAGSLWAKSTRTRRSVYADDTARNVGDSLTIVISESSSISTDAKRSNSKKTGRKAEMSGEINYGDLLSWLPTGDFAIPSVDLTGSYEGSFDGEGTWEDKRSVTDKVTVTVEDVLPNGNLVVEGTKETWINAERQRVSIRGIVRWNDLDGSNRVGSDRLSDLEVRVNGKGVVGDAIHRPNFVYRLLLGLLPF